MSEAEKEMFLGGLFFVKADQGDGLLPEEMRTCCMSDAEKRALFFNETDQGDDLLHEEPRICCMSVAETSAFLEELFFVKADQGDATPSGAEAATSN